MDSRTLIMLKTQDKRMHLFNNCTSILQVHNYQDIEIDIPITKDGNTIQLWRLKASFSFEDWRYSLDFVCCDGNDVPENIADVFGEMFRFVESPTTMQNINLNIEFSLFLTKHSFNHISACHTSGYNAAILVASRDCIKYDLILRREKRINEQISSGEDGRHIEIDSEKTVYYQERFEEYTIKNKRMFQYQGEHRIELSDDLSQISIVLFCGWNKSSLTIKARPLAVQDAEETFRHFIHCWMHEKCNFDQFTKKIKGFCFLPQNISDKGDFFEVFRNGIKYSISTKVDKLPDFDNMEGHAFERFCAEILAYNGFTKVQVTQGSRDQGVDIIAYKDDIKYGIQCKCYSSDIGNKAVQEVYAGKNFYNCDVAAVLTNRYFTKSAIELAQKNRVHLWDRRKLSELIENCKENLLGNY